LQERCDKESAVDETTIDSPGPRIAALRDEVMSRGGSFVEDFNPFTRDVALWRAFKPERSRVQVRAALLHELVRLAPVKIRPGWKLVGEHLLLGPNRADFSFTREQSPEQIERIHELGVTSEDVAAVREAVTRWPRRLPWGMQGSYSAVGEVSDASTKGQSDLPTSHRVFTARGWMENHSVRDYAKVLRGGFEEIGEDIERRLGSSDVSEPDFPRRENFWRAALEVCHAGILLGRRYAEQAERLAAEAAGPGEKARLEQIAQTCRRVPAHGARTFFEAVQSLWLSHILTCGEDAINANSIGRLDQILYPYYEADLRAGRVTREEAVEIMQELACKMYLDYDVQAIVLGGLDAEGNDAVNELSHVILDATESIGFVRDLSVRLHSESPPAFVRRACELVVRGGGIPFIFNDDCFVKALNDRGIALSDARDYAPIGCIELTVPGKANPHAVSGWFNAAKCLELALFDGKDPMTGGQWGPSTGRLTDHADFESLYRAYCAQVDCLARRMVYHCNRGELAQREGGPLPCWSTLTDDCIARGRDITDGGAIYNYHSVCFMGAPNVADSLMALKKLVFDEGQIEAQALLDALGRDFEGDEALRQMLLRGAPKYGNDIAEVDDLAAQVASDFIDLMDTMRSPLGGRYFVHLFTFRLNLQFGKAVGATPDGRRSGEPLAYSLSANQGRDEKGVTAMLRSLSKHPHDRAAGASAAIIDLDPQFISGANGAEILCQLVTTAVETGVGQLQWNVTSVERLRKAQEDPERYGNIAVRVAGYSQMFKLIDREYQDIIIARTKHEG